MPTWLFLYYNSTLLIIVCGGKSRLSSCDCNTIPEWIICVFFPDLQAGKSKIRDLVSSKDFLTLSSYDRKVTGQKRALG